MLDFILAEGNLPFAISLGLLIAIGLLEIASALIGVNISEFVESFLPDLGFDVDIDVDLDVDVDADIDVDAGAGADAAASIGVLAKGLSWMMVGRLPIMILFIIFLAVFGGVGLALQSIITRFTGTMLPWYIAVIPVLILALLFHRFVSGILARILPQDETEAVSEKSFIGKVAVITLGKAAMGKPAQARLKDEYGRSHYVMVEPETRGLELESGSNVLLVDRMGVIYRVIPSPVGPMDSIIEE